MTDAQRLLANWLEKIIAEEFDLYSYEEWKAWILEDQEAHGNDDYQDNWAFSLCETIQEKIVRSIAAHGPTWYLVKSTRRHKISGKTFEAYEVFDSRHFICCMALCGFKY